jgi:hypothetical protein
VSEGARAAVESKQVVFELSSDGEDTIIIRAIRLNDDEAAPYAPVMFINFYIVGGVQEGSLIVRRAL